MSETDSYICPDGYVVSFHSKFKKGGHSLRKYQCHECMNCINKLSCTTSKVGRSISRPENYDDLVLIEKNTYEKK